MPQKNRQSILHGAIILTASTMVVKIIGMFYKIPLGNILGAGGMSYFMSAYSIFNPILALSVAGFPIAVSKLVSEYVTLGRYKDVKRVFRVSIWLFLITGLCGSFVMFVGAGFFAKAIGNSDAVYAIAAMSPAVLFCCVMSAFRGYHQGLRNMTPTAVSQILESLTKLFLGIYFAWYFINKGIEQYSRSGHVFGAAASSLDQAKMLVLPYAAAGAVLGVTISTIVGFLFLLILRTVKGDSIDKSLIENAPPPTAKRDIIVKIIKIALPVCLAAAVSHISTLIDVATIMNRINVAIYRDSAVVISQYKAFLPEALPVSKIPSFLFGAFNYTNSLFNLVPALSMALGISALPAISSCWLINREKAVEHVRSVIKISALLSIPAGLGLSVLARPVLALLYSSRPAEVAIAAPLLEWMGIAAVLAGIVTPLMSTFQAVGRADLPLKLMLFGAVVKIISNYTLLANPVINIGAAPIGTILCYLTILGGGLACLKYSVKIDIPFWKTLGKPLICGIISAFAAHTSQQLLERLTTSRAIVLVSIGIGMLFYLVFILFFKIITKNEALMLPNGKKVAKMLEKLCFLG